MSVRPAAPGPVPVTGHATTACLGDLAGALSAAFADDPVQRWLFDGADDVDGARTAFFEFFVAEYFALGHVYVLGGTGGGGGAMWAPPDRGILHDEDRVVALVEQVSTAIGDEAVPRLMELARADGLRPATPHFYLGILGVPPDAQGRGVGLRLVEPVLHDCDRTGTDVHLESSNPRNIPFYERLGFRTVDDYRCGSDRGPLMTAMTRAPSPTT